MALTLIDYAVQIWREEKRYVAHAMPLDVTSAGPTPETARSGLEEAVGTFLKTAADMGTLEEILDEAGYRPHADALRTILQEQKHLTQRRRGTKARKANKVAPPPRALGLCAFA
jgi:predicted RNase H-like HicB family nuclease